jgi:predicted CoA-binding protein
MRVRRMAMRAALLRMRLAHWYTRGMGDWRDNLVESDAELAAIFADTKRIAVLGIKTEAQRGQPAYYVPEYMAEAGYEIVPVPVYYPDAVEILGEPVYRTLAEIPEPVDMVNVFRRPRDIPPHLPDILASKPRVVWMQQGISHDAVAEALARAGIKVVQDR